ncbi:hypothetical protein R80B4_01112 [Fibrobacteres bacterium R8-0-B4]
MTTRKLSLTAALLTAILLTCEPVPDFCGNGIEYNPDCDFCRGSKAYSLCVNEKRPYNPLVQGCVTETGLIGTRCADNTVVPAGTPCGGYTLTLAAVPSDAGTLNNLSEPKQAYSAGDTVELSASAAAGYDFAGWGGSQPAGGAANARYAMKGSSPQVTVVAVFKPKAAGRLITDVFPKGAGTVMRSSGDNDYVYAADERVTVTAAPAAGFAFYGWSGADVPNADSARITVTMNESKTLAAIFTPAIYTLKAKAEPANGGAVYINLTAVYNDKDSLKVGKTVNVFARADEGFRFKEWKRNDNAYFADDTAQSTTVTITASTTITAVFARGGDGTIDPPLPPGTGGGSDSTGTPPDSNVVGGTNCTSAATCGSDLMPDGKTWMTENLNIVTADSWCYENSPDSCAKYGRLYTWDAAKTACPTGWHLPSRAEWQTLVDSAGGSLAGKKLKAASGWNNRSDGTTGNGTDDYGFSALPGGHRYYSGGSFSDAGNYGGWWTATENGSDYAFYRNMYYHLDNMYEISSSKDGTLSVRCVGDSVGNPVTPPPTYKVTVTAGTGATGNGNYAAGATVSISAGTAPAGQKFKNWTTTSNGVTFANANSAATTFSMPSNAVTVTANFMTDTTAEYVEFDIRVLKYSDQFFGLFVVNQDIRDYDSLELRIYVRMPDTLTIPPSSDRTNGRVAFSDYIGLRVDIGIKYRSDGYQDVHFKADVDQFVQAARPIRIEDTYDPRDSTWGFYIPIPLGPAKMESGVRFRLDLMIDTRSTWSYLMNASPSAAILSRLWSNAWSFVRHSRPNDPADYPGVPTGSKDDIDNIYFSTPIDPYITVYRKNQFVWGYSP